MLYSLRSIKAASLILLCAAADVALGQSPEPVGSEAVRQALAVRAFETIRIDVPANERRPISIPLVLDGRPVRLDLRPASVRASSFRVSIAGGDAALHDHPAPAETTYRGEIAGMPGSAVAASIIDGRVFARILAGERIWGVQPLADIDGRGPSDRHAVYAADDFVPGPWFCGTPDIAAHAGGLIGDGGRAAARAGAFCEHIAELAFAADVEYYQANGSSIPNVVADIESIVNAANVIYERDLAITHVIPRIVVHTAEPDFLESTAPGTLLGEFRSRWNGHHSPGTSDPILRDVAHLMTGKDLDGSVIGVAFLGRVCADLADGSGYGLSQSRFSTNFVRRTALTAHELGHNWGAPHCNGDADCAIMCSGLGGCSGVLDRFGAQSIASMTTFRDSLSCLTEGQMPAFDCNDNCIEDAAEVAEGSAFDCNENGLLDSCDVEAGQGG